MRFETTQPWVSEEVSQQEQEQKQQDE